MFRIKVLVKEFRDNEFKDTLDIVPAALDKIAEIGKGVAGPCCEDTPPRSCRTTTDWIQRGQRIQNKMKEGRNEGRKEGRKGNKFQMNSIS